MEKQESYIARDYAKLKGVNESAISLLLNAGVLTTSTNKVGRVMIVDCEENEKLFKNKKNGKQ